jgi:hypothetical protein
MTQFRQKEILDAILLDVRSNDLSDFGTCYDIFRKGGDRRLGQDG